MVTKWEKATRAAIESGTVEEGKIRSMRRIMAKAYNVGLYGSNGSPSCSSDGADALLQLVEEKCPRVTDAQAEKGAAWLRANVFRKDGEPRATEFAQQFTRDDLHVLRHLSHFQLRGFWDTREDSGGLYCTLFPIYRAVATDGAFFDYVARAWQSGGNSFIINRGGFR